MNPPSPLSNLINTDTADNLKKSVIDLCRNDGCIPRFNCYLNANFNRTQQGCQWIIDAVTASAAMKTLLIRYVRMCSVHLCNKRLQKIINAIILLAFIILIISHEMYIKSFVIWKCDWLTQTYKFPWASLFNTSAFSVVHLVVGPTVLEWILLTAALLHGRPNWNLHELQKYSTRSFTDRLKMSTLY